MKTKILMILILAGISLGTQSCAGSKHKQRKPPKEHPGAYKDRVPQRNGYSRYAD